MFWCMPAALGLACPPSDMDSFISVKKQLNAASLRCTQRAAAAKAAALRF